MVYADIKLLVAIGFNGCRTGLLGDYKRSCCNCYFSYYLKFSLDKYGGKPCTDLYSMGFWGIDCKF
jgi:hypothetical protein